MFVLVYVNGIGGMLVKKYQYIPINNVIDYLDVKEAEKINPENEVFHDTIKLVQKIGKGKGNIATRRSINK